MARGFPQLQVPPWIYNHRRGALPRTTSIATRSKTSTTAADPASTRCWSRLLLHLCTKTSCLKSELINQLTTSRLCISICDNSIWRSKERNTKTEITFIWYSRRMSMTSSEGGKWKFKGTSWRRTFKSRYRRRRRLWPRPYTLKIRRNGWKVRKNSNRNMLKSWLSKWRSNDRRNWEKRS